MLCSPCSLAKEIKPESRTVFGTSHQFVDHTPDGGRVELYHKYTAKSRRWELVHVRLPGCLHRKIWSGVRRCRRLSLNHEIVGLAVGEGVWFGEPWSLRWWGGGPCWGKDPNPRVPLHPSPCLLSGVRQLGGGFQRSGSECWWGKG